MRPSAACELSHDHVVRAVQESFSLGTTMISMLDHNQPDVPTLRRVSLLVMRACDDETPGTFHDGLERINSIIEHMKLTVALGAPLSSADRDMLLTLVQALPKICIEPHCGKEIVRCCAIDELKDLAAHV